MPRLIDVHSHSQFAAYKNPEEVIDRALEAGVWIINVGTQKDTSLGAVKLSAKYKEGVYAAVGLHPIHTGKSFHDEKELGASPSTGSGFTSRGEEFDYEYYKKLGMSKGVVAIGECGLDYYAFFDRERREWLQKRASASGEPGEIDEESIKRKQKDAFEAQIRLSSELKKPLMIHCRSAFPDLISMLSVKRQMLSVNAPGVIHFFTGNKSDARALLDLGFSFSFGGVTTFTRDYDEVIKYVGIDKIVLETDAPYVAPVPYRGKQNESSYLPYIAEAIGKILEIDSDRVAEKTTENARKIFAI